MTSEASRYVRCALRAARRSGLSAEFKYHYRINRGEGFDPRTAAYHALYEWDLLDVVTVVPGGVHLGLDCGELHSGDHVIASLVSEPEYIRRQYVMGLGRGEALPGEEVVLSVETTNDFETDILVLGEDLQCFVVLRISVDCEMIPIIQGLNASIFGSAGLPLHLTIKPCQKITVVLRNESKVHAKIVGALIGTVMTKNPKWLSDDEVSS